MRHNTKRLKVVTVPDADYTASVYDDVILMSDSGNNRTVTVPDPATVIGKSYRIKKVASSAFYTRIVAVSGGAVFDAQTSFILPAQYRWVEIVSDGSAYNVLNEGGPLSQKTAVQGGVSTVNGIVYGDVGSLQADTITVSGRWPVRIELMPNDAASGVSSLEVNSGSVSPNVQVGFFRQGNTTTADTMVAEFLFNPQTTTAARFPANLFFNDSPALGSYRYKVQAKVADSATSLVINRTKLWVYELR